MKTVCNKLLSLMLVAVLLVSAVPFQAFATEGETTAATEAAVETTVATEPVVETTVATEPVVETTAVTEPVVETTAATEAPVETTAATESPVQETVGDVVQTPAAAAITDEAEIHYIISGAQGVAEAHDFCVKHIDTKVGAKVSGVPSSSEVMTRYAQIFGSSTGKQFSHWSLTENGTAVNLNDLYVTDSNTTDKKVLYVYAVIVNTARYKVQFQKFDTSSYEWVTVKESSAVAPNGTVGINEGFPTDSEISRNFSIPGFSIVGWEIGNSDNAFVAGSTKVTQNGMIVRPRYQGTVTLMANNPTATASFSTKTITVEIGEPIPALPNPGARDGYAFADWAYIDTRSGEYKSIANDTTLSNVSAHPNYFPYMGTTFHARWTESKVIYLYIHTQGNYQTATKIIPYYNAPATGALNLKYIDLYTLWPSFKNFDDNGDTRFGWYSKTQWKNFCAGLAAEPMSDVVYDVGSNPDFQELHIMLYDNTNGDSSNNNNSNNNYNNNHNTADKSNPTTGDMILIAVTVMAISAAALIVIFMKKRKASK